MKPSRKSHREYFWWLITMVAALCAATVAAQPGGWFKAGDHPNDYDVGTDRTTAFTGSSSGYIKSNQPAPQGFGTYMQMFDATEYRGKRLRFAAFVKSDNVENWAGLWMRIDRDRKAVAFDNMQDRPIKATQDWAQHAIVLDVDSNATAVAFGVLLAGRGTVWIDDLIFEVVEKDQQVTDLYQRPVGPVGPKNLDFEDQRRVP
jgi:RNA polymerase subunit RPABC4/transcription elongation factor Spt4